MDIWLLLCMAFVLLALAEYAVILGLRFNNKKNKIHDKKKENEEGHDSKAKESKYTRKDIIKLHATAHKSNEQLEALLSY